jgi:spermidine synthase
MTAMPPVLAGGLVFFTSAAVLVLEILAGRLLAPYVGVSLETYTGVIGTVLAAIALGTWIGGRLADRIEPRRILGPLLVVGGALSLAIIPSVRLFGAAGTGGGPEQIVLLALAGLFAPAAVLSAVTPTVVKLQLRDLAMTGRVVGWLSALGTTGAITGTFLAGFVLVAATPTSTVILALGGTLLVSGTVLWWRLSELGGSALGAIGLVALGSTGLGMAVGDPCDVETAYHCARVVPDHRSRPGGRALVLDTLRHSYVDLDNPMHLELRYTRVFADLLATAAPAGRPLDVLHVGGGGFTMPRYVAALWPGSHNLVLEIDGGLVELARQRLGLVTAPALVVRVGDARLLVGGLDDARYDVVLGDAFGGLAVPWHLTTLEFARELRRVMRPGAVYGLNLIDYPPLRFARAEVATLLAVFDHVAVIAPLGLLAGEKGGNVVVAASDQPFEGNSLAARIRARGGGEEVRAGPAAAAFASKSPVLTDDYAPVDQWLARSRAAGRR